jgi:hypothetical protein
LRGICNIVAFGYLDINGDGHDDIFTISSYGDSTRTSAEMFVWKNGDYMLDKSFFNDVPSMVSPRKVLIGDFNNDKKPDIFITGHGYDYPPFPGEYCEMLLSNTSGKYDLKKFDTKIGFFHGACSGDIDGDGDLDIFVMDGMYSGKSFFLINDGAGNFTTSTTQIDVNKLLGAATCELVDVDKDGFLDLLFGGGEPQNSTKIFWGSSSHIYDFNNVTVIPAISQYGSVVDMDIADIDGDGVNEIAIDRTGYTQFYDGWNIQIVKLNNRSVTDVSNMLIEKNSYIPLVPNNQEWIIWMRFKDYDGNGKLDYFSSKNSSGLKFVRWELQNGKLVRII